MNEIEMNLVNGALDILIKRNEIDADLERAISRLQDALNANLAETLGYPLGSLGRLTAQSRPNPVE